jgi:hypothetical protein
MACKLSDYKVLVSVVWSARRGLKPLVFLGKVNHRVGQV